MVSTAGWGSAMTWPVQLQDVQQGGEVVGVAGRGTMMRCMQLGGVWWCGPCSWEGGSNRVHVARRGVATWRVQLQGAWRAEAATLEKHKHNKSQLVKKHAP